MDEAFYNEKASVTSSRMRIADRLAIRPAAAAAERRAAPSALMMLRRCV